MSQNRDIEDGIDVRVLQLFFIWQDKKGNQKLFRSSLKSYVHKSTNQTDTT